MTVHDECPTCGGRSLPGGGEMYRACSSRMRGDHGEEYQCNRGLGHPEAASERPKDAE